jgi:hypothetical protein
LYLKNNKNMVTSKLDTGLSFRELYVQSPTRFLCRFFCLWAETFIAKDKNLGMWRMQGPHHVSNSTLNCRFPLLAIFVMVFLSLRVTEFLLWMLTSQKWVLHIAEKRLGGKILHGSIKYKQHIRKIFKFKRETLS